MRTLKINNEDSLIVKGNKIVANVGGQELVLDIEAVNKLVVYTTCMGLLSDDMGMIIHIGDDTTIVIMSGHECYESFLFDGLGRALPIDHKKIIEASGCTEAEMFVIYKKDSCDFPFTDGPHAVCLTCCHVLEEHKPIKFVFHDKDSWQFLCGETHETADARHISLDEILHIDDNMKFFARLECGDYAEMDEETGEWMISHDYYPEGEEDDAFNEEDKTEDYIPMNRNDYLRELQNQKIDEAKVKQDEIEFDECDELSFENVPYNAASCESNIEIILEDGEIKISGSLNLGYIGTYTDSQLEMNDTLEEIREWDIVQDNLDEDCSDKELIAFLNRYFNEFTDKITRNIDNINGTFLLQVLTDMDSYEINFMVIDELFSEDKLPYGNEEDIAEVYNFARDGLRSLIPYLETPNDGCIPKGHIETLLRSFYPAFDFNCFIANIVPEVVTLCDGSIAFQCSDAFDEAILCGAYAELDEELSFKDWHNF